MLEVPGGAQMMGVSRWGSDDEGFQGSSDDEGLQVRLREDSLCMVLMAMLRHVFFLYILKPL